MGQAADQLSKGSGTGSADELRAQIDRQRSELGRDLEVLGDKVSPGRAVARRRAAVGQSVRGFRDRIMGVADSATSAVGDTASRVGDTAGAVGERVGSAPGAARQAAQGSPLAVGLVAFGAGAVVAALVPTTAKERRLAQQATPALEKVASEAGSAAQHAVEEMKPLAQDAVESLKQDAQDAAASVKQEAQGAAEEVRSSAT